MPSSLSSSAAHAGRSGLASSPSSYWLTSATIYLVSLLLLIAPYPICSSVPGTAAQPHSAATYIRARATSSYKFTFPGWDREFFLYDGDSVHNTTKEFRNACIAEHNDSDACDKFIDDLSLTLYQSKYTPTRANSQIEDYKAARFNVIQYIQETYGFKSYLEIGCDRGDSFLLLESMFDVAVCVDPASTSKSTHTMTSDNFFSTNSQTFDVIFIDGLHEAYQVVKDIRNALRVLNPNGFIVMHDCNPRHKLYQVEERLRLPMEPWTGDTWKAALLMRMQYGLDMIVGDFDYGVGVIRLDRNGKLLPEDVEMRLLMDPLGAYSYEEFAAKRETLLRLVSFAELKSWISSSFSLQFDRNIVDQDKLVTCLFD